MNDQPNRMSRAPVIRFPGFPQGRQVHIQKTEGERMRKASRMHSRIRKLVSRVLVHDDNDQALALVALIYTLVTEKDFVDRDGMALYAMGHAYTLAPDFSSRLRAFMNKAVRGLEERRMGAKANQRE